VVSRGKLVVTLGDSQIWNIMTKKRTEKPRSILLDLAGQGRKAGIGYVYNFLNVFYFLLQGDEIHA
jgi:hypothetical protein